MCFSRAPDTCISQRTWLIREGRITCSKYGRMYKEPKQPNVTLAIRPCARASKDILQQLDNFLERGYNDTSTH